MERMGPRKVVWKRVGVGKGRGGNCEDDVAVRGECGGAGSRVRERVIVGVGPRWSGGGCFWCLVSGCLVRSDNQKIICGDVSRPAHIQNFLRPCQRL